VLRDKIGRSGRSGASDDCTEGLPTRQQTLPGQLARIGRVLLSAGAAFALAGALGGWSASAAAQQPQRATIYVGSTILVEPAIATPLAIQVAPLDAAPKNHFVRIRGLPAAATLSEGHSISAGSWAVPLVGLPNLKITVPIASQGRFNVAVSFVSVDGTVLDDAKIVLVVGANNLGSNEPSQPENTSTAVASLGPSAPTPAERVSPERQQALGLHAKGQEQLERGNVSAARMFFRRAAESGLAQSALALAGTYDPDELAKLKVIGLQPDLAEARKWYEKARELGSIEANARLKRLGSR